MDPKRFKNFIIGLLRRGSYKWAARSDALRAAKVERGKYTCNMCKGIFRHKEVAVDHIQPVIDPNDGFVSWDEYIERMYVPMDGFQVLCKTCHDAKTRIENAMRTRRR
jgi:5-methylcytosine-specific restriction endonuclease McrA